MQWHHYLGYLLKQKRCGIYVSQMQRGGKYYNVFGIPIRYVVQMYSYGESWLMDPH